MSNLQLSSNSFKNINIEGIDITSFSYYGSTEDYDYNDRKSFNNVSFRLLNPDNTQSVFEQLKSVFNLNPNYAKVEDYLSIRTTFEDWEKDKRPRITIYFKNGSRGMTNPPSFSFN